MSTLFADFVDAETSKCDQLPLVHTSTYGHFHSLVASHRLQTTHCSHFAEPLLYLFYGRPAYRPQAGGEPTANFSLCPITFIFKPHRFPATLTRAFPFDTGAAYGGFYAPHCTSADINDFRLTCTFDALQKLVSKFFGSNGAYFAGNLRALENGLPPTVNSYVNLVRDPAKGSDDRRYSVEVQIRESLDLTTTLLAVVLPANFLTDPLVLKLIRQEWSALPIVYETYSGGAPRFYYQTVLDKLRTFYQEYRWIS